MEIYLYKMTSDPICYNKKKEQIAKLNCELKLPVNIETPTIIIKGNYHECNYVYIPYFKRFYFVNKVTGICDDLVQFDCVSDVLSSNDITQLTALVERQEFKRNTKLIDNELLIQSNNNFICRTVGAPVISDYTIYITTCGGEGNNV